MSTSNTPTSRGDRHIRANTTWGGALMRSWRRMVARVLLTATVCLLVLLALPIAAAGATPSASGNAAHPVTSANVDTVAMSRPRRQSRTAPAPAAGALRCASRPLTRGSSEEATATGFEIDVIVDHSTNRARNRDDDPTDRTDRRTARRGPLVVSCGSRGQIVVLACDNQPPRRSTRSGDPISYRDRTDGYDRDDWDFDGWDRDNDVDLRDWGLDSPDQLDDIDLDNLSNLRTVNATTDSRTRSRQLAGLDINVGGLVSLHQHNDPTTSRRSSRDSWERYPDHDRQVGDDSWSSARDWDYHDINERSGQTGVCRLVSRR